MNKNDEEPEHKSNVQQHFANERTLLAWLRTCIALIGLGFVISKFDLFFSRLADMIYSNNNTSSSTLYSSSYNSLNVDYTSYLGLGIVIFGVVLAIFALKNYLNAYRSIESGIYIPKHLVLYVATFGLVVLGFFIILYLLFFHSPFQ